MKPQKNTIRKDEGVGMKKGDKVFVVGEGETFHMEVVKVGRKYFYAERSEGWPQEVKFDKKTMTQVDRWPNRHRAFKSEAEHNELVKREAALEFINLNTYSFRYLSTEKLLEIESALREVVDDNR